MRMIAAALLALPLIAGSALAQDSGTYVNFGYTHSDLDGNQQQILGARVGQQITENFAVEAEGGFGIDGDRIGNADVNTNVVLGAFAVARAPVAPNVTLLARAGYHHTWAEATVGSTTAKADEGSFAVGVGAELAFDRHNGVRVDYTRLTDDGGSNLATISYVRRF